MYIYIYYIHIFYIYSCVLHTNDVHDVEIDTEQNKDLQHVTLPSLYPCLSGAHGRSLIHLIFVVNALRISAWSISENGHHKIAERMPSVAQKLRFLSNGGTLPKNIAFKCHPGVYVYFHVRAVSLHPALYTNQRQMPRCISPRPFAAEGKQNHSSASAGCL
jgi:hypothetical protein